MIQHTSWTDTIVAIATPPGVGAIGVIRVSGSKTFEIVNQLFPSKDLSLQSTHTLHVGVMKIDGNDLDEVVVSLFKGPRSYTGEDVIEISCHGSPFIHQQVINALVSKGARLAKAGEFTQRAFLNGKKDLAQAEAVADIIASNTEASLRAAMHTMRGGFSEHLKKLREELIRFSALIELELDFSQEDVEFADRSAFHQLIDELIKATTMLASSFQLGNVIKNGVSVAIVGKPNAGKSTLLNALLNENRAIVSEIPGTTRDTIEELINIDGIIFRLIDTAGIRDNASDLVEHAGIERSREKMRQADLVIYLFDANDSGSELKKAIDEVRMVSGKHLIVINKIDVIGDAEVRNKFSSFEKLIFIAARQELHLEVLKERMTDMVLDGKMQWENCVITNARHYHALNEAAISLKEVKKGLNNGLPGDLLALDIRRSLQYLGEITGEVSNEDMLDYIFSKFCIGK